MLRIKNAFLLVCLFSMIAFGCPNLSTGQALSAKDSGETTREKHVRKAIRHLEAAGLHEDARRLENEQLTSDTAEIVEVSVRLVEFRTTDMRELGIDWQFADTADVNGSNFDTVLSALRRNNLAKIVASPTLRTFTGRTSSLRIQGENSIPEMQLKVLSEVLENGGISLNIHLHLGDTYEAEATVQGKEHETQIAATSETPDGTTLYLLVTPHIGEVEIPAAVQATNIDKLIRELFGDRSPEELNELKQKIEGRANRLFFEKQMPAILAKYGLKSIDELEPKLAAKSTSIKALQSQFLEEMLSNEIAYKKIP